MSGIYVHIPFCSRRCNYCDFFFTTNTKLTDDFLISLDKEIQIHSASIPNQKFDTIFFGGGTPSILTGNQLLGIINRLRETFDITEDAEISLEANPEDLTNEKIRELYSAGVNRLSIGVQSFIDSELQFLTRHHTSSIAGDVVKNSLDVIDNVSIDIIYSLPSQRAEDIIVSIDKAKVMGVKHISAYTLTYEDKTLLTKSANEGKIIRNTPEHEATLYETVSKEIISRGFRQYEVSNFAIPGYESRHNKKYWKLLPYLGLGPSAHSFIGNRRWNNLKSVGKYCELVNSHKLPIENDYELNEQQLQSDFIMLALRAEGINFTEYKKRFGKSFEVDNKRAIGELVQNGFAELSNDSFRLSTKGYAVADEIIARYF